MNFYRKLIIICQDREEANNQATTIETSSINKKQPVDKVRNLELHLQVVKDSSQIQALESNTNQKTSQDSKDRIKVKWGQEGKARHRVVVEGTNPNSSINRRTRNSNISIRIKENKITVKEVGNMEVIINTHTIKKETKIKQKV